MALFDDKILNPEERSGGFQPFESDDQSFQLEKIGQYPGELPDIGLKKAVEPEPIEDEVDIDALFNAVPDQNVQEEEVDIDALFNAIPDQNNSKSEEQPFVDEAGSQWTDWDNSINIENETPQSPVTEEETFSNDLNFEEATIDDPNIEAIQELSTIIDKNNNIIDKDFGEIKVSGEETFLDDDFLADLSKEIAKSKGKKPTQSENQEINFDDMLDADKISQFASVDNLEDVQTFDISAIPAVHPSSYGLEENLKEIINDFDTKSTEEAPIEKKKWKFSFPKFKKSEKVEKPKKVKVKKEKSVKAAKPAEIPKTENLDNDLDNAPIIEEKEKKPFAWKKMIIPGAALALLIIIGTTIALVKNENLMRGIAKSMGLVYDSTTAPKPVEHKKAEHKEVAKAHADTTATKDSAKHDEHQIDSDKTAEVKKDTVKEVKHEVEQHKAEPIKAEQHNVAKAEPVKKEVVKKEPVKVEKPKVAREVKKLEPKQHITKRIKTPPPAEQLAKVKKSDNSATKIDKKSKIDKDIKHLEKEIADAKKKDKKVETKLIAKSEFTVEVYSTPSRDDAEDWLNKISRKGLKGASISTYKVRDKIWYRVRFGNFETIEAARSAAIKSGFSQSRIDRIK